jgi:nitrate reductase delta subunit
MVVEIEKTMDKDNYRIFARLFEYPSEQWIEFVKNCEFKEESLIEFSERVKRLNLNELEEIYTRTFDLQAICYPYAGYQLFGEDYRRGEFMVKMKELFRENGFYPPEDELPDHIGVIFEYLSHAPGDEVLIDECLVPVLEKFINSFKENTDNPYYFMLKGIYESITNSRDNAQVNIDEKELYTVNIRRSRL